MIIVYDLILCGWEAATINAQIKGQRFALGVIEQPDVLVTIGNP
jgi:hypothetical protein